jgi:hypothetical protein
MRRILAISIFVICLLKLPWADDIINLTGLANFAWNSSPSTVQLAMQQVTPTVLPPTQKPAKSPHITPTHSPRPTAPPPEIPPPTDRRLLHSMILFAVIASLTVVFGLWTNRQRINPR